MRRVRIIVFSVMAALLVIAVPACNSGGGGKHSGGSTFPIPPTPPPPPPSGSWMTEVGSYNLAEAYDVKVSGNYAYVAAGAGGLVILNVSNPAVPTLAGSFATASPAYNVAINGNYVYVSAGGMQIINISNPASPSLAGTFPGNQTKLTISGSYAYTITSGAPSTVSAFNLSNPAAPSLVGSYSCSNSGGASSIFASGNKAFLVCGKFSGMPPSYSAWLEIISVSNPASPSLLGTYAISSPFVNGSVYASGNYAYLGVNGDVLILDVSNPASPALVSSYYVYEYVNEFVVLGDKLYLSIHNNGAGVFNVSEPASPGLIGRTTTNWQGGGIAVSGYYMYFTTNEDPEKLIIFDVSNPPSGTIPKTPSNVSVNRSSSTSFNVTWADNADNETGYRLIRWGDSTSVEILLGPNITSYQDTGLGPCEGWSYNVQAYNSNGRSFIEEGFEPLTPPPGAPAAPSNFVATAASSSAINLTWTDNATNELGFCLTRYPARFALSANATSYQDTGLINNTMYTYLLRAFNTFGSSTPAFAQATTLP